MNSQLVTRTPQLTTALWLVLIAVFLFTACGKKTGPVRPPTPPAPAPTAPGTPSTAPPPRLDARVEPERIPPGESATLIWDAQNAEVVVIDQGIGEVDQTGRLRVFPTRTSSYRIVAVGPGGNTEKTVTLQVGEGAPPTIAEEELAGKSPSEQFVYFVKPIFFEYDSSELKDEAKLTLDGNIRWLVQPENRSFGVVLEGHTDERGTGEYNLALGDKRAQVVRAYMVAHGVAPSRLVTVSLGEERPFDPRPAEDAYALNRRVHFVLLEEQAKQP